MIKVNLKYPNGAVYVTQTASVADLLAALQNIKNPDLMPVFLVDKPKMGLVPIQILGEVLDPAISPGGSFQIEQVVDLE